MDRDHRNYKPGDRLPIIQNPVQGADEGLTLEVDTSGRNMLPVWQKVRAISALYYA